MDHNLQPIAPWATNPPVFVSIKPENITSTSNYSAKPILEQIKKPLEEKKQTNQPLNPSQAKTSPIPPKKTQNMSENVACSICLDSLEEVILI